MPPATNVPDDRPAHAAGPPNPPDPPGPPRAASVRRVRRSRLPWLALSGVGLALVVASGGGLVQSETRTEVRRSTAATITIEAGSSEVEVAGGAPAGTIEITRTHRWGLGGAKPSADESWEESAVTIRGAECAGLAWRCGIDYAVRVPDPTAVTVEGGSGDVLLVGSLGTIRLDLGSGDVETRDLVSGDVTMTTGSGDVDLELRSGPAALEVRTGSGDVSIDAAAGEQYRLDVDTGSGNQNLDLASDPSARQVITVRTGSGDVDIE